MFKSAVNFAKAPLTGIVRGAVSSSAELSYQNSRVTQQRAAQYVTEGGIKKGVAGISGWNDGSRQSLVMCLQVAGHCRSAFQKSVYHKSLSRRVVGGVAGHQQQRYLSSKHENRKVYEGTTSTRAADTEAQGDQGTEKSVEQLLQEACLDSDVPPPDMPLDSIEFNSWKRNQTRHVYQPKTDPRETSILLFPGQGSQFVGMGQDVLEYPNVQEMFNVARDILGYDLLDLCLNGPQSELDKTVHCQPAVFVSSLAAVERLKCEKPKMIENCIGTSGFSIGEFSALVFAGAMSFEEGLEVVKERAEAMQEASELVPSGMMTVFLGPDNKAKMACEVARRYCVNRLKMEDACCSVANFLYPECKVIAGNIEALDFIEKHKKDFGLVRTKHLPVSGAFHTGLMKPAKKRLWKALSSISIHNPIIPVYSNVDGRQHRGGEHMVKTLLAQLKKPVRWEQIMHSLYSRKDGVAFPNTYEVGPGRQLGTILKLTNNKAYQEYHSVDV